MGTSVRSAVQSQFEQVAVELDRRLVPLADDVRLTDCGLDSLSVAIVVTRLEEALGVDPFGAEGAGDFPVTFGDFVRLYEGSAS